MTDARKGDFGILGFQLSLRIGTDGRAVAEGVSEHQARAIVIKIAAEVSGKGAAVVTPLIPIRRVLFVRSLTHWRILLPRS